MTDPDEHVLPVTPELRLARAVKVDLEEMAEAEGGAANALDDIAALSDGFLARQLASLNITTVQAAMDLLLRGDNFWQVGDILRTEPHPYAPYGPATAVVTETMTPFTARVRYLDGPHQDEETTVVPDSPWVKVGTTEPAPVEPEEPETYQVGTRELLATTAEGYGWKIASNNPTELELFRSGRSAGDEWVHCLFAAGDDTLTEALHSDTLTPQHHWAPELGYTCREWALLYLVR